MLFTLDDFKSGSPSRYNLACQAEVSLTSSTCGHDLNKEVLDDKIYTQQSPVQGHYNQPQVQLLSKHQTFPYYKTYSIFSRLQT